MKHPLWILKELLRYTVMLRVGIIYPSYAIIGKFKDLCIGHCHKDRRMGGNDELGASLYQRPDLRHKGEDPHGRQRRLGLVEDIESVSSESVLHDGKKALAVGSFVKRHTAVTVDQWPGKCRKAVHIINVGRYVVKTFRTKEKSVTGMRLFRNGNVIAKLGVGVICGEGEIPRSSLGVKAVSNGDCLKEGGFTRAVFAYEKRHRRGEGEPFFSGQMPYYGKPVQIRTLTETAIEDYVADVVVHAATSSPYIISKNCTVVKKKGAVGSFQTILKFFKSDKYAADLCIKAAKSAKLVYLDRAFGECFWDLSRKIFCHNGVKAVPDPHLAR